MFRSRSRCAPRKIRTRTGRCRRVGALGVGLVLAGIVGPARAQSAGINYPPSFGQVTAEGQYVADLVEVYAQTFENGLDGLVLTGNVALTAHHRRCFEPATHVC